MVRFWRFWYSDFSRFSLIGGALAAATLGGLYLMHNPAISVVEHQAMVAGISPNEDKTGRSGSYRYFLRLDDGRAVLASDYLLRPHLIGSRVTVEFVTYRNGRTSYRFPNFFGGSVAEP